ncbi:hypothetical protein E4U57_007387, partial [Claviceps arundinis]
HGGWAVRRYPHAQQSGKFTGISSSSAPSSSPESLTFGAVGSAAGPLPGESQKTRKTAFPSSPKFLAPKTMWATGAWKIGRPREG